MLVALLEIFLLPFFLIIYFVKMAGRIVWFSRSFSTSKALEASLASAESLTQSPYRADIAKWKKLFFFVCVPAITVASINAFLEEPAKRPEFKKYSYLRIRNKTYPWRDGVKTLFHNPHTNALPDGYETEDHH